MPAEADNSSFSKSSHEKSQTKLSISRNPATAGYFLVTSQREGVWLSQHLSVYQLLPLFGGRSQVPAEANKKESVPTVGCRPSHPFSKSSHGKSQTKLSISQYPVIAGHFLVTPRMKGVRLSQK